VAYKISTSGIYQEDNFLE